MLRSHPPVTSQARPYCGGPSWGIAGIGVVGGELSLQQSPRVLYGIEVSRIRRVGRKVGVVVLEGRGVDLFEKRNSHGVVPQGSAVTRYEARTMAAARLAARTMVGGTARCEGHSGQETDNRGRGTRVRCTRRQRVRGGKTGEKTEEFLLQRLRGEERQRPGREAPLVMPSIAMPVDLSPGASPRSCSVAEP